MPESPTTPPVRGRPGRALHAVLVTGLVLVAALVFAVAQKPSLAETGKVDIVYVYVSGEGPTAKAWYAGAPSPGVPFQEALNKFARDGYQVAAVTEDLRSTIEDTAIVVLLQRGP